jgi:large subunit ribosomal protein L9
VANKAVIEQMKASAIRKSAGEKDGAVAFGEQLNNAAVVFERKTSATGQLFGSVTSQDIAAALEEQGLKVDRRKIHLDDPLKTVGEYHVPVRIHREVTAHVQVTIKSDAPEGADAPVEDTDTGFVSLYTGELDDGRD